MKKIEKKFKKITNTETKQKNITIIKKNLTYEHIIIGKEENIGCRVCYKPS